MIDINQIPDETWVAILVSEKSICIGFLALQLLLFRLKSLCKKQPEKINEYAAELKRFFIANQKIPIAIKDLEKLIDKL
jgi:hypothetical protein